MAYNYFLFKDTLKLHFENLCQRFPNLSDLPNISEYIPDRLLHTLPSNEQAERSDRLVLFSVPTFLSTSYNTERKDVAIMTCRTSD